MKSHHPSKHLMTLVLH